MCIINHWIYFVNRDFHRLIGFVRRAALGFSPRGAPWSVEVLTCHRHVIHCRSSFEIPISNRKGQRNSCPLILW